MQDNWCEIFRTGRHKDSKGNTRDWTLDDLNTMKDRFENVHSQVPICVGHPKTSSPAYGWFDKLKIEGNKLFSTFKNVLPEFVEAYKKGLFKNRSLSLDPDLTIRHLAFLGAQAPAIKGLEQFCFSSDDEFTIRIDYEDNCMSENLEEKLQESEKRISELELELKEKEAELLKQKEAEKNKEFSDWCDEMIDKGNLVPAKKQTVINILSALSGKSFNFSDEEESAIDSFKELVASMKRFDFSDVATKSSAKEVLNIDFSDAEAIAAEIKTVQNEYRIKGVDLNPMQALEIIKKEK